MTNDQQEKKYHNDLPIIESFISKSKDGKKLIHRTVITHIKPVAYYEAIIASTRGNEEVDA